MEHSQDCNSVYCAICIAEFYCDYVDPRIDDTSRPRLVRLEGWKSDGQIGH